MKSNETTRSATVQSAPEKIGAHKIPAGEQAQVIALLQQIVELLSEIDETLTNIGGKLDDINSRMP